MCKQARPLSNELRGDEKLVELEMVLLELAQFISSKYCCEIPRCF